MSEEHRQRIVEKVRDAKHMSKPDAENAAVLRDADGRWLCEIYTCGHTVETKDGQDYDKN